MKISVWILAIVPFLAAPVAAQSAFPDVRGIWKGDSESIVADVGTPHHPGAAHSGTRLDSTPFTMKIDMQDGRRLSGTYSSARSNRTDYRGHIAYGTSSFCRR